LNFQIALGSTLMDPAATAAATVVRPFKLCCL